MIPPSYDIIQYEPSIHGSVNLREAMAIRRGLPSHIRDRLARSRLEECICIDSRDHDAERFLDDLLKIDTRRDYLKWRYVEVSKRQLDRFPFYNICPRCYEAEHRVFFDFKRPTCNHWGTCCPSGYERISPVRIVPNVISSLGIGRIGDAWHVEVDLLVSADVKRLFDDNSVTGLTYEPCEIGTKNHREDGFGTVAYVARIEPRVYSVSDHIEFGTSCCPVHQVITLSYSSFNERIPRSRFGPEDFHVIEGVQVGERRYRTQTLRWVVSSRVVKLLLREKVKGLLVCTSMLNEKFVPLVNLEDA
ncbi:MAG: hypothetical protein RBS80_03365 [Thermoguttaceae bacterium]|jgi:hypothetical protein|nr:hypothetical protein [Thermoguttaceae bacterium]